MTETVVNKYFEMDPTAHFWHWEVPVYLFLGGVTAGLMVLSAFLSMREKASREIKMLPLLAPVLISFGMLALFLDLDYKVHVYRFYLSFEPTSPMSWGSWILMAIYPATLALGILGLDDKALSRFEWAKAPISRIQALISPFKSHLQWSVAILGIGLGVYTGILLSTLDSRAAWNSSILGPLFLISGLSTGAAFMLLLPMDKKERKLLIIADIVAISLELALIGLYLIGLVHGGSLGREAASLFLGGQFTGVFWSLVIIMGLITPLILEVFEVRAKTHLATIAPVLILAGGLSLRWIIVLAGQV